MSHLTLANVTAFVLALSVTGCGRAGSTTDALIDDRGGRVAGDRGAAIDVPPGAVDVPTRFTVQVEADAEHLSPDVQALGPMVTFGPEGTLFATSVRITIPASREPMVLLTRARGGNTWTRVDGAVWDSEAGVVRAEVMHFSHFVPVGRAGGGDAGAGPADAGAPDAGDPCVISPRDPACVTPPPVLPSCNAATQDCVAGEMCVATDQESGYDWGDGRPAWCIPAGSNPLGAACVAPSDCSVGTQCVIQTMYDPGEGTIWYSQEPRELPIHGGTCMELCLHASPGCGPGEVCHPIQLWGFSGRDVNDVVGVCAPPPTSTPRP